MGRDGTTAWVARVCLVALVVSSLIPSVLVAPAAAASTSASPAPAATLPLPAPAAAPQSPSATTTLAFTVNDLGDASDATLGDGICATSGAVCTLRAAVEEADAKLGTAGADGSATITFSVAGTISLGAPLAADLGTPTGSGTRTLTIDGCPSGGPCHKVRIDGGNAVQVLDLAVGPPVVGGPETPPSRLAVSLANLTIADGSATNGAGLYFRGDTLAIDKVTFEHDIATASGGALFIYTGSATITNSTFKDVAASTSSTTDGGGAVYTPNISDAPAAVVTLTNDTISTSDVGAALFAYGGNIFAYNSILANAGFACAASFGVVGGDHDIKTTNDGGACPGTYAVSAGLAAYGDYGGVTSTFPIAVTSPARDAGDNTACASLTTDQRGQARSVGSACDVGAFEFEGSTAVTLTSDSPVVSGTPTAAATASVTFTAVVVASHESGAAIPTGTVAFTDGATVLAAGVALDGSGHATYTTSTLALGTHTITAAFTGTSPFTDSTASVTEAIVPATTTATLAASSRYVTLGSDVTLSVGVSSPVGSPSSGTVTFKEGATDIGTASVDAFGGASLIVTAPTWGPHTYTATFGGSAGFSSAASGAVTIGVQQPAASYDATAPSAIVYTQAFTVTVGVGAISSQTATGTVSIRKDSSFSELTSCALSSGSATCSISGAFVPADFPLHATYGGDDRYSALTLDVPVAVNAAGTTLALATSASPVSYGTGVTFTATLGYVTPATLLPSSPQISFYDGATLLGSATANGSGIATLSTTLAAGTHPITASYAGDGNYASATSSAVSEVVTRIATTTTVTATIGASVVTSIGYGTPFTVSATVAVPGGAPTATGTVTFYDGVTSIGSASLNGSGAASISYTPATACPGGSCAHSLTASYAGTANFTASSSGAAIANLVRAPTNITLSALPSSGPYGTSVTFTAFVTRAYMTPSLPTGSVVFAQPGHPDLGTATIDGSGRATLTTTALLPSGTTVIADYMSDDNFDASEASTAVNISKIATTTTLVSSPTSPSGLGQSVVLTATVSGTGPALTGTLTIDVDLVTVKTLTLSGVYTTTYTISVPGAGNHWVIAHYSGDADHNASDSSGYYHVINSVTPGLTVTPSTTTPAYGGMVTLTTQVSGRVTGVPYAGRVTFIDFNTVVGYTTLGTVNVDAAGAASYTWTAVNALGDHTITASYGNDPNYVGGSATATFTASASATTTTVGGSCGIGPCSGTVGTTYSLVATVTSAVGTVPTGNALILSGGSTLLGSGALNAFGALGSSWTPLYRGTYSLTARYLGATGFSPSDSAAVVWTVSGCAPTLTVSGPATIKADAFSAVTIALANNCYAGAPAPTHAVLVSLGTDQCAIYPGATSCLIFPTSGGIKQLQATLAADTIYEQTTAYGPFVDVTGTLTAYIDEQQWVTGEHGTFHWDAQALPAGGRFSLSVSGSQGTTNDCTFTGSGGACTITWGQRGPTTAVTLTYSYPYYHAPETVTIRGAVLGCYVMRGSANQSTAGAVTITPAANCAGGTKWREGTDVLFTAVPAAHYQFGYWNNERDDPFARGEYRWVKVADRPVFEFANFDPICWQLTATPRFSGSLDGGTISVNTPANCPNVRTRDDMYFDGTVVTLTAVPEGRIQSGSQFGPRNGQGPFFLDSWGGAASGTASSVTVTMDADKSVTATFDWACYALTLASDPAGQGTLGVSPGTNCFGSLGTGLPKRNGYRPDTTLTFTATGTGASYARDITLPGGVTTINTITGTARATIEADMTATAHFGSCAQLTVSPVQLVNGYRIRPTGIGDVVLTPKGSCPVPSRGDGWFLPGASVTVAAYPTNYANIFNTANAYWRERITDDQHSWADARTKDDRDFWSRQIELDKIDMQRDIADGRADFSGWSDTTSIISSTRIVTVDKTMSFDALYQTPGHCVSVPRGVTPSNAGSISVSGQGSGDCDGDKLSDQSLYTFGLQGAIPSGAQLQWIYSWAPYTEPIQWSVDTSFQDSVSFDIPSRVDLKADRYFTQYDVEAYVCYPVHLNVTLITATKTTTNRIPYEPGGSTSPYFDMPASNCPLGGATVGSSLTVKAGAPPDGYTFVRWEGAATGSSTSATVTADKVVDLTAVYQVKCFTLSLDHVARAVPAANCPDGSGKYIAGTTVSLLAEDRGGDHIFRGWNGPTADANRATLVTVDKDLSVSPDYYDKTWTDKASDFFTSTLPDVAADVGKKIVGATALVAEGLVRAEYGIAWTVGAGITALGEYGTKIGIPSDVAAQIKDVGQQATATADFMTVSANCVSQWAFGTPALHDLAMDMGAIGSDVNGFAGKSGYAASAKYQLFLQRRVVSPLADDVQAFRQGGIDGLGQKLQDQAAPLINAAQGLANASVPGSVSAADNWDASDFATQFAACVKNNAPPWLRDAAGGQ